MTTPLEFSQVYTILNKIKEGDDSHQAALNLILSDFQDGANAESFLHQLGQMFLYIGVQELYKFTSSEILKFIGQLTKEEWDELVKKNQIGMVMLKIIEIIGEDKIQDLDPETIYFITNLLNEMDLIKIRNKVLISALPQRV